MALSAFIIYIGVIGIMMTTLTKRPVKTAIVTISSILFSAVTAEAQDVTVAIGAEWTTGDYGGDTDTDLFFVPLSLGLETNKWFVRASLPYLEIDGPGLFLGDNIPVVRGRGEPERGEDESVSGFSDLSLTAGHSFDLNSSGDLRLDLTGRVKVPTASDEDNLGSGEFDYSFAAGLSKVTGQWSHFGDIGYRITGDPEDRPLNDTLFATIGTSYLMRNSTTIGLAYDFSESATPETDNSHEISSWLSFRIHKKTRLQLYGLVGLSDGGPDYGIGTRIRFKL